MAAMKDLRWAWLWFGAAWVLVGGCATLLLAETLPATVTLPLLGAVGLHRLVATLLFLAFLALMIFGGLVQGALDGVEHRDRPGVPPLAICIGLGLVLFAVLAAMDGRQDVARMAVLATLLVAAGGCVVRLIGLLDRGEGLEWRSQSGGLGDGLGGWAVSPPVVLVVLALGLAGAAVALLPAAPPRPAEPAAAAKPPAIAKPELARLEPPPKPAGTAPPDTRP
jgi:hypothetical protein